MKSAVRQIALAMTLVLLVSGAHAAAARIKSSVRPAGTLDRSLANEVDAAINRAQEWLVAKQKEDGSWSNPQFPAISGLVLQTLAPDSRVKHKDSVDKAVTFILSCRQKDGGIYRNVPGRKGGGLSNYNTAISMTALHALKRPELVPAVQQAREFIAGSQHFGDDVYRGGFGYDRSTDRAYADLLNTYYSVVAMRETQDVEDLRPKGEKRVDIDWTETVKFIEKMQNMPEAGKEDAGGIFYKPGESKAGTTTNKAGVVVFRSYGSMTYAGLLALVYANVDRDDVRVRSAFDWSAKHWTLEENPGMGAQGLYFFYTVLTKSLAAYGQDLIPQADDKFVNWRAEVAAKLVANQKIDPDTGHGYWVNESGRFWENDPLLVTAYSVRALQMLR